MVLAQRRVSLPFNRTLERLKGNRSQLSFKVGYIHVKPQNLPCQIMFVLLLTQIVIILHLCSLLFSNMPI